MKILIINGPNINMLGIREKGIYGAEDYDTLLARIGRACEALGVEHACFQSNHEGAIVDRIQQTWSDGTDAIVINPAACTHTSVAILDALKAVSKPAVEVHISDVNAREPFRQLSYAGMACEKTIVGHGLAGYEEAIGYLARKYGTKA